MHASVISRICTRNKLWESANFGVEFFHRSWRFFAFNLLLVSAAIAQTSDGELTLPQVGKFVEHYCLDCHNTATPEGDLSLDLQEAAFAEFKTPVWENVIRKLRHRQMPPSDAERPDEQTYLAVVNTLEKQRDAAVAAQPNPGRAPTFRRLTRREYTNAIRDLLALEIDAASLLPKDEISHGFDNMTVGELSPTLLAGFVVAARHISGLAVGRPVAGTSSETLTVPLDLTQEQHLEGLPFGTRGGAVFMHNFPQNGEYEIQLRLTRDRDGQVEGLKQPHEVLLLLDEELLQEFSVEPIKKGQNHSSLDRHLVVKVPISAGPHSIAATFAGTTSALRESQRRPSLASFNRDRHPRLQPALYSVTINGPEGPTEPGNTPSRQRIFACYPQHTSQEADCGKQIIATFMRRAFRRPVSPADLETPMEFFNQVRAEQGFEAGIAMALRAILVNPHFLFRIERDPLAGEPGSSYEISDFELASRLSFFLWSSIPDDELLDLAERDELHQADVLNRQVRRMLADARSAELVDNFAAQWLHLPNLADSRPDRRLFMDFDENLRVAMLRETRLLLHDIIGADHSLLDLLRADFTYVNERLAKHYDIPHVYGSHFRRVQLPVDSHRGGILSHGSILTVTSYANRTSPVLRGKWILDNILGMPPKPPPPDIPQLKENSETGELLNLRARITAHREDAVCARCHDYLDPLGFALEHFDAVGRWRELADEQPIDAAGSLADGQQFDGVVGLQAALLNRPELFVQTVTEKLLSYALGRGLEADDAPAVRKIVGDARQDDYRCSSIVLGIVHSPPFRMRIIR